MLPLARISVFATAMLAACPVFADDFDDAVDAWLSGDDKGSLPLLARLPAPLIY